MHNLWSRLQRLWHHRLTIGQTLPQDFEVDLCWLVYIHYFVCHLLASLVAYANLWILIFEQWIMQMELQFLSLLVLLTKAAFLEDWTVEHLFHPLNPRQ